MLKEGQVSAQHRTAYTATTPFPGPWAAAAPSLSVPPSTLADPAWRAFASKLRALGLGVVAASDYDILRYQTDARYRPRVSGTQRNEMRRREWAAAAAPAPTLVHSYSCSYSHSYSRDCECPTHDPAMQAPANQIWGTPMPLTAFVSGPLAPPPMYFAAHYAAIAQNASFVLGPSAARARAPPSAGRVPRAHRCVRLRGRAHGRAGTVREEAYGWW
ncbi:hypothetical protein C8J57DRAFT_1726162 [Mycena rebaudengoi]|nr:hypothetical protein C8J57DRAFT_1726162 [Mycena rebaudengoi]